MFGDRGKSATISISTGAFRCRRTPPSAPPRSPVDRVASIANPADCVRRQTNTTCASAVCPESRPFTGSVTQLTLPPRSLRNVGCACEEMYPLVKKTHVCHGGAIPGARAMPCSLQGEGFGQLRHVWRQRRGKASRLPDTGCTKASSAACNAWRPSTLQRSLRRRRQLARAGLEAGTVGGIAEQRVWRSMGNSHAHLVGAAGHRGPGAGGLATASPSPAGRVARDHLVARQRVPAARLRHHGDPVPVGGCARALPSMMPRQPHRRTPGNGPVACAGAARPGHGRRTPSTGARCAASGWAATWRRPVVSLSSRCTMPGRSTPPIPDRDAPQCAIRALTSVPEACPGRDARAGPSGFSITIRCDPRHPARGIGSGAGTAGVGGGTRRVTCLAGPDAPPGPARLPCRTSRRGADQGLHAAHG